MRAASPGHAGGVTLGALIPPPHLAPAPAAPLPVVVDGFLHPSPAERVARVLAAAPAGEGGTGGVRPLDLSGPGGFDLDRWWLGEVLGALSSPWFLAWLAGRAGVDPGDGIDFGAHALPAGREVGWHHDRRRGQRLGVVWFSSDPPPVGGALRVTTPAGPVDVAPVPNRLVAFDAREPHAVARVEAGERRTLVARTWRR